jgi:hypothetical protein
VATCLTLKLPRYSSLRLKRRTVHWTWVLVICDCTRVAYFVCFTPFRASQGPVAASLYVITTAPGRENRIPELKYEYRVSEQGAQGQYYYLYQSVGLLSSLRLRPTAAPSHHSLNQQPRSSNYYHQACDLGTSSDSIRTCVIFRTRATCNIVNSTRCAKGSGRALTR